MVIQLHIEKHGSLNRRLWSWSLATGKTLITNFRDGYKLYKKVLLDLLQN